MTTTDQAGELHRAGIRSAQAGDLQAAVELIGQALVLRPGWAEAWDHLGRIRMNQGEREKALEAYRRLARLRPADSVPHYALGLILRDLGRLDEAIGELARAIELKSDFVDALFNLAMTLRSRGRLDEAIAAYAKVIALNPNLADAHNNLANALHDKGRVDEAIGEYLEAIRLNPRDAVTHLNLGNAYTSLGRIDDALPVHRRAAELAANDARMHEALAATLLVKHDMPAAIATLRRAIELAPQSAVAWNGLGLAMRSLGRFDEAADCFRRAVAIEPDNAPLWRNLTTVGRAGEADAAEVERLRRLLGDAARPADDRVDAGFALGKLLDDAGRYADAFASYADANALFKASRAARGQRFDVANLRRMIDRMIASFTPDFFTARRGWGDPSELPVFIVGMPRTGTTLVEQIAASHSKVFGAGELRDIENISATLSKGGERTSGEAWDAPAVAAAAKLHIARLRELGGERALRVLDKMPGNVLHLGLIAVLFPGARVILCRRDARDTCLSCYFQHFDTRAVHLYLYDLADCARQYVETERLAAHWLKVLPLHILEVQYESLVANQEAESRRLIDFLGLPWDPACLEFHRAQRSVYTASVWQVRQPMYASSVGRWRHYERHLGPMLQVLGQGSISA